MIDLVFFPLSVSLSLSYSLGSIFFGSGNQARAVILAYLCLHPNFKSLIRTAVAGAGWRGGWWQSHGRID